MPIQEYIQWAKNETATLSRSPDQTVEKWRQKWVADFQPMVDKDAIFELASLIVARWEFLGCLYKGYAHKTSNQDQAAAYAKAFLEPVNRAYGATHSKLLPQLPIARILFEMLRNKSLHGYTPSGVYDAVAGDAIVWRCVSKGDSASHLTFVRPPGWTVDNALFVDGETFLGEFDKSLAAFVAHLQANAGGTAHQSFKQGFWWKLHPKDNDSNKYTSWATDGP